VEDHAPSRVALLDEDRRRDVEVHAVLVMDGYAARVSFDLAVVERPFLAVERGEQKVEDGRGSRRGIKDKLGDNVDVEAVRTLARADRGFDRHRPLGVEDPNAAGERAGVTFDVFAQRLVPIDGKAMKTRRQFNADRGLGEQDFSDWGEGPQRQIAVELVHTTVAPVAPLWTAGFRCYRRHNCEQFRTI
jgi:hypothetical protein